MTSHYILCRVSGSFDQIAQNLSDKFGNVHNERWNTLEGRIAVILGESYFFRSNSDAAILMIMKEVSLSETNLEIISCAGASGLAGFSLGSESSYVHEIRDSLQKSGFKVEVIKEINYYDSSSLRATQ
ncbi:MAG: hypothetical protein ABSF44_15855 [Candidatus Bathyarchaeia archaeon]